MNVDYDYQSFLIKINAMIKNLARSRGMHPDEVYSDLADME